MKSTQNTWIDTQHLFFLFSKLFGVGFIISAFSVTTGNCLIHWTDGWRVLDIQLLNNKWIFRSYFGTNAFAFWLDSGVTILVVQSLRKTLHVLTWISLGLKHISINCRLLKLLNVNMENVAQLLTKWFQNLLNSVGHPAVMAAWAVE